MKKQPNFIPLIFTCKSASFIIICKQMYVYRNLGGGSILTVDKLGDNKLLIKLDESDMENFELDFGKMSFKNEDNQKVII